MVTVHISMMFPSRKGMGNKCLPLMSGASGGAPRNLHLVGAGLAIRHTSHGVNQCAPNRATVRTL